MSLRSLDNEHFYIDDELIDLVQLGFIAERERWLWCKHDMFVALSTLRNYAKRLADPENHLPIREEAIRRAIQRFEDLRLKSKQRIEV